MHFILPLTVRASKNKVRTSAQGSSLLRMPLWVVYVIRGLTSVFLTTRRYVGLVQLLPGEGPQDAAERRRKEHEGTLGTRGALWLRI